MTANSNPDPRESAAGSFSDQETQSSSVDDHQGQELPESPAGSSGDLYGRDGLHIWADLNAEGALVISGQDLKPPFGWDEYEYSFTIASKDLPLIGTALGGTHSNSVLDLLVAEGEQIVPGVQSWLDSVGARYEFWN